MREYPLLHNDIDVGTVRVEREGMYYRIVCTCNIACLTNHRIVVKTERDCVDLGKCARGPDGVVLRRFIPLGLLSQDTFVFGIRTETEIGITALNPYEKFPAIALLPYGRFIAEGSNRGIVFDDKKKR